MGQSDSDFRATLEFVLELQTAPDVDAFRQRILRLRELVPGHVIGYNEVSPDGETFAVLDPPESNYPGVEDVFARFADQHPVIQHFRETGDHGPLALSDFLSEDDLHSLDLYRHIYASMGVEDQLCMMLPSTDNVVIGIVINRRDRGFSERDRELLRLIRPHAAQAFMDARMREALEPLSARRVAELGLTDRQRDVARLLTAGQTPEQIASELTISPHTARKHLANLYEVLGVHSRAECIAKLMARS
jgi:DNA-binding CsgD family transcriptional regulator